MKRIWTSLLLPFLWLTVGSSLQAQHAFQEMFPGLVPAERNASAQTPDGGFCTLAREAAPDGYSSRFILIKTNADGLVEWSRIISTPASNDYPTSLRQTDDGGFYALGSTSVDGSWDQDILLIRLSAHGDPLWSKTYNYGPLDWASDIAVLPDGSAVIVGSTQMYDTTWYSYAMGNGYNGSYKNTGPTVDEREAVLILRIDQDGETLWGRTVPKAKRPEEYDEDSTYRSYGETVCLRDERTVSVIVESLDFDLWLSTVLDLSFDGSLKGAVGISTWNSASRFHFSTLANDIVALPNGGLAVAGITGVPFDFTEASFVATLDNSNRLSQLRTFVGGENSLYSSSILPVGKGFLICGMKQYDNGDVYYDPIFGRMDTAGSLVEARKWMAYSFYSSINHQADKASLTRLWHPRFSLTDDEGILSVGTILTKYEDYSAPDQKSLLIARFTPDIATCGDQSTETVDLEWVLQVEEESEDVLSDEYSYFTSQTDFINAWGFDGPVNAVPEDFRTYSQPETALDGAHTRAAQGILVDLNDLEFEGPEPYTDFDKSPQERVQIDDMPIKMSSQASAPVSKHDSSFAETMLALAENVQQGYDMAVHESLIPSFTIQKISLLELKITSQTLRKVDAEDFSAEPIILCQENTMITSSSGNSESTPTEAEYLHLLPNSIRTGKAVSVEFSLMGNDKPDVSIINIARGEVVRQAGSKNVTWSSSNGKGTATVETAGLTTGTYLVRVRSGEKQLTAKLEVQ